VLETLANKGIVFVRDRDEARYYSLMPLLPGIFEMQFIQGIVDEKNKRLARLFEDYFKIFDEKVFKPLEKSPKKIEIFPFSRVLPVEKELPAPGTTIHPYDKVSEFIAKSDHIAVSTCYCRHHGELIGDPCDRPKEVCMSFGPQAKYIIERNFGRELNKNEAREVMDIAEEAGLVHCTSNTGDYITFMCNCCSCHCGIMKSIKSGILPMTADSSFIARLDDDLCTGCGTCEDRCQVDAIAMGDERAVLDVHQCIGCALCVSTCPEEALSMEPREKAVEPPANTRALNKAMASSFS